MNYVTFSLCNIRQVILCSCETDPTGLVDKDTIIGAGRFQIINGQVRTDSILNAAGVQPNLVDAALIWRFLLSIPKTDARGQLRAAN